MKSLIRMLFGNGSHDEVDTVLEKDERVHDLKNKYTESILQVQLQTKKVEKEVEKLKKKVDRTYLIAQALGKI